MTTLIGKQREIINLAFDRLGGIDKLIQWSQESSDNYKEFIKLYVKLIPPIKQESAKNDTHETFIELLMTEEKKRLSMVDKSIKLIDVINENESQES